MIHAVKTGMRAGSFLVMRRLLLSTLLAEFPLLGSKRLWHRLGLLHVNFYFISLRQLRFMSGKIHPVVSPRVQLRKVDASLQEFRSNGPFICAMENSEACESAGD